ncbi:MAG: prepilin peptidase [Clostridia bacterium]|nr:prepilin peptidase [Clostridia bacterium]
MYINDVHILYYVGAAILGAIIGWLVNIANYKLPEEEKFFSKDFFKIAKKEKINYWIILVMIFAYIALVYFCGIHKNFYGNLPLIKFGLLIPMLLSAFVIDYRLQIIPNRLNLTMFEIGLLFTFIYGIVNINIAGDMLLGMITGAGIFLLITLIGGLIAGKEAMGFGDVKLMGALGLYFGFSGIIVISLIAFLLGAIISIILLATKKKKSDEYIPFGPFIVLAAIIAIFVPFGTLVQILLQVFTLGMYGRLN